MNHVMNGTNNQLTGFSVLTQHPLTFSLLEFDMDVPCLPLDANVYNENDVAIVMELVSSTGRKVRAEGFYYEEYLFDHELVLVGKAETAPRFRIRVNLPEAGEWRYTVTLRVRGEERDVLTDNIAVEQNTRRSRLLRVEPNARRVFATEEDGPLFMVGENLCWHEPNKDFHLYCKYMSESMADLAKNGCNIVRVWDYMDGAAKIKKTYTTMYQDSSAKWDRLFETAEQNQVYVSMVLIQHGEISPTIDGRWNDSVWHVSRGGPITEAEEFFTDPRCVEGFKNYLRYVVSRWGYNEFVIWELCNEIEHSLAMCKGHLNEVRAWIREMANYIRKKDVCPHLVTNSAGIPSVPAALQDDLDFMYFHLYNHVNGDVVRELLVTSQRMFNCPVLVGEVGFDGPSGRTYGDETGAYMTKEMLSVHQGCWTCLMSGGAGTAMTWFWGRVRNLDGHWIFKPVAEMSKRIPWQDPAMRSIDHSVFTLQNHQLNSMGYQGDTYLYLWFYDNHHMPINRAETTFEGETAAVTMPNGTYAVSWYDTRSGECVCEQTETVTGNIITLKMPVFSKDIFVSVVKR